MSAVGKAKSYTITNYIEEDGGLFSIPDLQRDLVQVQKISGIYFAQ